MAINRIITTIVTETETLITVGSAAANRVNYFHIVKKFTNCSFTTLPGFLKLACKLIDAE